MTEPDGACDRKDAPSTLGQWDVEWLTKMKAEMQRKIQERLQNIKEVKDSVELSKKTADRERDISLQSISMLNVLIKKGKAELVKIRKKQKAGARHGEMIIEDLEQEISELQRRSHELEQPSDPEDHLHLLQKDSLPSEDWSEISVHSDQSLSSVELSMAQQYAVDVTLDSDTAHPKLLLSEDRKQVSEGHSWQDLPDNPQRFNIYLIVLGKEGFSSGRFYYEVQVKDKTEWDLGVARQSISRKGQVYLGPGYRHWTIVLRNRDEYLTATEPPIVLSLREKPQKVGVFVDYEEGLISFFDVNNRSHIYSFTGQNFTEKLYPYFSPSRRGGDNSAPLVITPWLRPMGLSGVFMLKQ
uniref:B30.2/SPRY domain-containing protein n=1 Tax=Esox lucius TaxID=8010 RepID=A0A3P9ABI5_ESOLU